MAKSSVYDFACVSYNCHIFYNSSFLYLSGFRKAENRTCCPFLRAIGAFLLIDIFVAW